MNTSISSQREIRLSILKIGAVTWFVFSLHSMITELQRDQVSPSNSHLWIGLSILFLILFYISNYFFEQISRKLIILLLIFQSFIALWGNYLLEGSSVNPCLLIIIAAQVALIIPFRYTWIWLGIQNSILIAILYTKWPESSGLAFGKGEAFVFGIGHFCFQCLSLITVYTAIREVKSRLKLAQVNQELIKSRSLLKEATQRAERLHISRELHDVAGHNLMALDMHLDMGVYFLKSKKYTESLNYFYMSKNIGKRLLKDVRQTVQGLRTSLCHDLLYEIYHLAEQTKLDVHLDVTQDLQIDCPIRSHIILRSLQEILVNATLHAQASQIWIILNKKEGHIFLQARDNGQGMKEVREGMGLKGMRERIEELKGELKIYTSLGEGTKINIQIPMSHPNSGRI